VVALGSNRTKNGKSINPQKSREVLNLVGYIWNKVVQVIC